MGIFSPPTLILPLTLYHKGNMTPSSTLTRFFPRPRRQPLRPQPLRPQLLRPQTLRAQPLRP